MASSMALEVSDNKLGAYQEGQNIFLVFGLEVVSNLRRINWREMELVLKNKRKPGGRDDVLQEERGSCGSKFRDSIC